LTNVCIGSICEILTASRCFPLGSQQRTLFGSVVHGRLRLPRGQSVTARAATFDEARADVEAAWRVFLSKRTEVDFQEWRDQHDLDGMEICHVGSRRTVAVAAADQHHALRLWRVVRQPPARGEPDPRSPSQRSQ
jgi:hypothetical protein